MSETINEAVNDTSNDAANQVGSETSDNHSIGIYLKIWFLLFVLSVGSYMVDYLQLQGALRWSLIIIFMLLKAGFIVSIFMHFIWERFALKFVLLLPIVAILVFILLMALEADYIHWSRLTYFGFD